MSLCGEVQTHLAQTISNLFFFSVKPFFVPSFYSPRPGVMQPWAHSAGLHVQALLCLVEGFSLAICVGTFLV